jgi:mannose-6-phosphate isomerase-like protein (cupin superfamily)
VVVRGGGRMKLDDEIVELKESDAVRVPPGGWVHNARTSGEQDQR